MGGIDQSDALSLGELCDLFQRVEDGAFFWDRDLRLIARNDLACDLYGLDRSFVRAGLDMFEMVERLRPGVWARNVPPLAWVGTSERQTRELILQDFRDSVSFEIRFEAPPQRHLVGSRTVFRSGVLATVVTEVTEREEALRALAEQKSLVETILDNLDEGVVLLDAEDQVVVYNRRLAELCRSSREAGKGPQAVRRFIRSMSDASQSQDWVEGELSDGSFDQAAGRVSTSLGHIRTLADGRIILVNRTALGAGRSVLVFRDITERRKADRQSAYLKAMVENVSEGVMLLDRQKNIVALNQKLLDHYQIPPGEFWPGQPARRFVELQRDLDHLPAEEQQRRRAERLQYAYSESTERSSRRRELGDGRVLHVTRIPFPDGSALGVYRDVTAEEERERLLERAREEAEEASRMKSAFLARMSHELRTPMQGVLGMAALLDQTEMDERQRRFLEVIRASGSHMLRLIEDLLTLSTGDAGGLHLQLRPVGVARLVGDVVGVVRPMADERGLRLDDPVAPEADLTVEADPTRLFQILVNLLTNAVRYTDEGHVSLEVTTRPAAGRGRIGLDFAILDTGRGIPADELERIFERFYQAQGHEGEVKEGVGLGLAVSSSLARTMGGRIDVHSTVGEGSVFTLRVELPVIRARS